MEIKHTLKEPRSLADPVLTAGYTRELRLRDVCWKQANSESSARSSLLAKQRSSFSSSLFFFFLSDWFPLRKTLSVSSKLDER